LIDPSAKSGVSKCGLLTPDATPYAFCSFRAYNDNAAGKPVGNLIFLLALNETKLAQLSQIIGMPLTVVAKQHTGQVSTLKSTLGNITVTTATVGSDKMVLDAAVPTTTGSDVLLEFTRPRPIHAVATSWSEKSLAVIGGILLLIIGVVMDELNRIRTNTAEVHSAANTIEQRVEASTKLTHAVLSQSQRCRRGVELQPAEHRRRGRDDRRRRQADEPAGPQCDHRGGACGRERQGLSAWWPTRSRSWRSPRPPQPPTSPRRSRSCAWTRS